MKIAYFSPLNPMRSGISDYSEELLPLLSEKLEIDLFVGEYEPNSEYILSNYRIMPISSFDAKQYAEYDEVIYHIGNNTQFHKDIYLTALKFPGIVVLHDYSIHHLIANLTVATGDWDGYIKEMEYNYGEEGAQFAVLSSQGKMKVMWETDKTIQYPANKRIIDHARGVIVHSNLAMEGVIQTSPGAFITYAPLFTTDIHQVTPTQKEALRTKYNISQSSLVFASFGFVSKAKRIESVLEALQQLRAQNPNIENEIRYLIVGEEEPECTDVQDMIKRLNLEKCVTFIGFVTLEEFKDYIMLSDVCINLRYPTQGETSASLLRILGYGKPAVVSQIGTFAEFPDQVVFRVQSDNKENEINELARIITRFLNNKELASNMGRDAYNYIKQNNSVEHTAEAYHKAIQQLADFNAFQGEASFYYGHIDRLVNRNRLIFEGSDEIQRRFASIMANFFD